MSPYSSQSYRDNTADMPYQSTCRVHGWDMSENKSGPFQLRSHAKVQWTPAISLTMQMNIVRFTGSINILQCNERSPVSLPDQCYYIILYTKSTERAENNIKSKIGIHDTVDTWLRMIRRPLILEGPLNNRYETNFTIVSFKIFGISTHHHLWLRASAHISLSCIHRVILGGEGG